MPPKGSGPGGCIVLIGMMGSGKTEVGRRIGELTGRQFVDTDELVQGSGLSIADIWASEGESGFRRRERAAVAKAAKARSAVVSTGGGAVLTPENVRALKRTGLLVYLRASTAELASRLGDGKGRPLLEPGPERRTSVASRIQELYDRRAPVYEGVADVVVDVDGRAPAAIAKEILARVDVPSRRRTQIASVDVPLDPSYRVHVGRGVLRRASALLPVPSSAEKACLVSHPRVARLWGDALTAGLRGTRLRVTRVTFPEGEERKTPETAVRLQRRLAGEAFHRGDVVIALGGGVVGDVAGYVASTYARGIAVVQVPTTLLAMVDSAIGGKTGVNLPEGKNLVGTFHQPIAVLADLDTLKTLSEREFRGGIAEVVKYAFIADPSLGRHLLDARADVTARGDALEAVVLRSAAIKASVVAADERDSDRRMVLNYGHTLGHALERLGLSGRGPALHHGEAVAIGMTAAAWLSVELGMASKDLVEEHVCMLESFGLPSTTPQVSWEEVRRHLLVDKKYAKGFRFVVLREAGAPEVVSDVPQRAVQAALERVTCP